MFSLLDSLAWHQRVSSFLFGRRGISFGTAMAISGAAASPKLPQRRFPTATTTDVRQISTNVC